MYGIKAEIVSFVEDSFIPEMSGFYDFVYLFVTLNEVGNFLIETPRFFFAFSITTGSIS